MTATKAIAGGVAANIVTVILWAVSNIPGWGAVPDEPKAAIIALVSAGGRCVDRVLRTSEHTDAASEGESRRRWDPTGFSRWIRSPDP